MIMGQVERLQSRQIGEIGRKARLDTIVAQIEGSPSLQVAKSVDKISNPL